SVPLHECTPAASSLVLDRAHELLRFLVFWPRKEKHLVYGCFPPSGLRSLNDRRELLVSRIARLCQSACVCTVPVNCVKPLKYFRYFLFDFLVGVECQVMDDCDRAACLKDVCVLPTVDVKIRSVSR